MITKRRWLAALLVAGGCLALVLPSGAALQKDKKNDKSKEETQADDINELVTAYQLADFGRKYKSPEALIAAAGLLRKIHVTTKGQIGDLDAKVLDDNGKPIKVAAAKAKGLPEEADELFDEARALGTKLPGLEAMIKAAKSRDYAGDTTRGALGGPKRVVRPIQPGEAHRYDIPFDTHTVAAVGVQSTGQSNLRVKMWSGKHVHFEQVVLFGQYTWQPKGAADAKNFAVRIENVGKAPTVYTLYTN